MDASDMCCACSSLSEPEADPDLASPGSYSPFCQFSEEEDEFLGIIFNDDAQSLKNFADNKMKNGLPFNQHDLDVVESSILRMLHDLEHHHGSEAQGESVCRSKDKHRQKLVKLLQQFRSLKEGGDISFLHSEEEEKIDECPEDSGCIEKSKCWEGQVQTDDTVEANKDVLKEVRNVRNQNRITHVLLGVLLVSSLIWKFSELSVALLIKQQLTHPFRAIGRFLFGRDGGSNNHSTYHLPHFHAPTMPHFESPHLPHIEIPPVFPAEDRSHHSANPNGKVQEILEFVSQSNSNAENKK